MDAVQTQIDALDKESKELITQAQHSITQAVQLDGVAPQRIAVVLAQRFSAERIALSFPVVCLLDAMLQPAGGGSEAGSSVLEELWPLVTPLFAHYHEAAAALREKVTRLVGRWRLRQRISRELAEALVSRMENGAPVAAEGAAGTAEDATAATRASAVAAYTQAEITSYRDLLRGIVGLLERLPTEQAAQYADAVLKERLAGPTPAARTVLQGIHTELRREVTSQQAGGPHAPAVTEADDSGEAREALGKLLDQLQSATETTTGAQMTSVVRYKNPLVSDIAQRQSVGQRTGFGALQPHPSTTGAGALYYPRRSTDARLPFRIPPAKQAGGGAVRLAFPTPEEWLAAKDMAALALFEGQDAVEGRSTSNVFDVARKRTRE